MVRRRLRSLHVLMLATVAVGAGARAQPAPPATTPPNVVLILMDDLGYGDLGSYGAPDAKTPNIDRLGREGVRFTDFYANGSTCSPTRAGFITGRYQQRYGIEWPLGSMAGDSARGLLPSDASLPQMLRSRGYATGLVGKWHLGWNPEFHPRKHGFDEFWGFLGGFIDYYSNVGEFNRHDLFHNESAVTDTGYLTNGITARAKAFIESNKGRPFFLEVSYNATHWPFQIPGLPRDKRGTPPGGTRDGTRADYVAMLESADRGVGEILATLERRALTRNTLVIFTSDNGGEWLSRNAPLFHRKATLWEGGIRVPALLRWPARLPRGVVSRQVGITMDLTASILSAAGVTLPASYQPDGIDLLPPVAEGRVIERTLFWRSLNPGRTQRAVRRGRWKYLRDGGAGYSGYELIFDLASDPGERRDLTAVHREMRAVFRRLLADWEAEVDSSRAAFQSAR